MSASDEPLLFDDVPPKKARRDPVRSDDDKATAGQLERIKRLRGLGASEVVYPRGTVTNLTRAEAVQIIAQYEQDLLKRDRSES